MEDCNSLQVSVNDLQMMAVLYPRNELLEESPRLGLRHLPICDNIVEELSPGILQHNDDI